MISAGHGRPPASSGREDFLELAPAARDARLDGPDRELERHRDLLVAPFLDVAEHDRHPEIGRQEPQGFGNDAARFAGPRPLLRPGGRLRRVEARRGVGAAGEDAAEAAAGAIAVLDGVVGDGGEPGSRRSVAAKSREPSIRVHEDLLGHVVGVVPAHGPDHPAVHRRRVAQHELAEGGFVARGAPRRRALRRCSRVASRTSHAALGAQA